MQSILENRSVDEQKDQIPPPHNEQKLALNHYQNEQNTYAPAFDSGKRQLLLLASTVAASACAYIEGKLKEEIDNNQQTNKDPFSQTRRLAKQFWRVLQRPELSNLSEIKRYNQVKEDLADFRWDFIGENNNVLNALIEILYCKHTSLDQDRFSAALSSLLSFQNGQDGGPLSNMKLAFSFFCLRLVNKSIDKIQSAAICEEMESDRDGFKVMEFKEKSLKDQIAWFRLTIHAFSTYWKQKLLECNSQEAYKSLYSNQQLSNIITTYELKGRSIWADIKDRLQGNSLKRQEVDRLRRNYPVIADSLMSLTEESRNDTAFGSRTEEDIIKGALYNSGVMTKAIMGSLAYYGAQREKVFCLLELLSQYFEYCAFMEELIALIAPEDNLVIEEQEDLDREEEKAEQPLQVNTITPDNKLLLRGQREQTQQTEPQSLTGNQLEQNERVKLLSPRNSMQLDETVLNRNKEEEKESVEVDTNNKIFSLKTIIGSLILLIGLFIGLAFIIPQFRVMALTLIPGHAALGIGLLVVLTGALFVAGGALLVMEFNTKNLSRPFITTLDSQLNANQIDSQTDPSYCSLQLSSCAVVAPKGLKYEGN